MSAEAHSTGRLADGIGTTARPGAEIRAPLNSRRGGEFGGVYSANVGAITTFFARRCTEPQTVADLTSETFVEAVGSFHTFDPVRGSPCGWLFGIARNVLARHYAALRDGQQMAGRLAGRLVLGDDGIDELAGRIDAQREGREVSSLLLTRTMISLPRHQPASPVRNPIHQRTPWAADERCPDPAAERVSQPNQQRTSIGSQIWCRREGCPGRTR